VQSLAPLDAPPATGRGSSEDKSVRVVRLAKLNRAGGKAFDPSVRYAVGFDVVPATESAKRANVDQGDPDYAAMVKNGWTVFMSGTATFKGTDCKASSQGYDFGKLPKVVRFKFGFGTPVEHINCQNPDLTAKPFAGEEAQRGIQLKPQGTTYAQLTFHVDHPFWHTVDHEAAELYFDQMAAFARNGELTLDDLAAADLTQFKDPSAAALPWRACIAGQDPRAGTRAFDPGSAPVDPNATPDRALRNYRDYVAYITSTMGHVNADGLCAIARKYPSPR
jgi:hypothetical protein